MSARFFTSIPTDEAVRIIRQRLEQDNSWQDRTNLNVDQLTQILELCLNTTYFMYSGDFLTDSRLDRVSYLTDSCQPVHGTLREVCPIYGTQPT